METKHCQSQSFLFPTQVHSDDNLNTQSMKCHLISINKKLVTKISQQTLIVATIKLNFMLISHEIQRGVLVNAGINIFGMNYKFPSIDLSGSAPRSLLLTSPRTSSGDTRAVIYSPDRSWSITVNIFGHSQISSRVRYGKEAVRFSARPPAGSFSQQLQRIEPFLEPLTRLLYGIFI